MSVGIWTQGRNAAIGELAAETVLNRKPSEAAREALRPGGMEDPPANVRRELTFRDTPAETGSH
jgi:hypothetical protein